MGHLITKPPPYEKHACSKGEGSVIHIASHRLPYKAHVYAGVGGESLVLLGCEATDTLHLLRLEDGQYRELWSKPCVAELVRSYDYKCVLDDVLVTQDFYHDGGVTVCWDLALSSVQHQHKVGSGRNLLACLQQPHIAVYSESSEAPGGGGGYQLAVFDGDRRVGTVEPPGDGGGRWYGAMSACTHAPTGRLAVCDAATSSVDVFASILDSSQPHHTKLDYVPGAYNAIACTGLGLVIREDESTVLHLHTWCGEEVDRVDVRCETTGVGLGRRETRVHGVGICDSRDGDSGSILHVAVGGDDLPHIRSLHAFKLRSLFTTAG